MNADKKRPINMRLRSAVISWTAGALNWVNANIKSSSVNIGLADRLRWWMEGQLQRIFERAYAGSDEELQAVYQSEIPVRFMSDRQREIIRNVNLEHRAHCPACGWEGRWADCHIDHEDCPSCGNPTYLDPFEPEEGAT